MVSTRKLYKKAPAYFKHLQLIGTININLSTRARYRGWTAVTVSMAAYHVRSFIDYSQTSMERRGQSADRLGSQTSHLFFVIAFADESLDNRLSTDARSQRIENRGMAGW